MKSAVRRIIKFLCGLILCWNLTASVVFSCPANIPSDTQTTSARVYLNPNTGRFWSMDSYAGSNEDPSSLHKYLYGEDNPVNGFDPSGQSFFGFDGTGNAPPNNDGDVASNVYKMWYGSTDPHAHYEIGVGTSFPSFPGQAFGAGMAKRERKAMRELIADRSAGDYQVDIIGFSRGGIEAIEFANRIADRFPDEKIRFVGLFDPVGSVGLPGGFGSYRTQLPSTVGYSVEALAADEDRNWFPGTDVSVNLQKTFRGTHSDIGGGWPNQQLSDWVLQWMIQQATGKGVGMNLAGIQSKFGWDPQEDGPINRNHGITCLGGRGPRVLLGGSYNVGGGGFGLGGLGF